MVRISICAIFALVLSVSLSFAVSAQEIPGISSPITIISTPDLPSPGGKVTLRLQSFNVDLDSSFITWVADGKVVSRGNGARSATIEAGAMGTNKKVTATISTNDGDFTASIDIIPGDLSLVWEAATYVPPFYKGKALHSHGGVYKVVAISSLYSPNGTRYDPRTLSYTWKKNGAADTAYSGYGKSSYSGSQTSFIRQGDQISVEIASSDGLVSASKSILVAPTAPEVLVYEDSPLYGIRYEKALSDTVFLLNEELSLAAEPYFFTAKSKTSSQLSFDWSINDAPISEFSKKNSITLRKPAGQGGAATVGVTIANSLKLLQSGNRNLVIRYDQTR